MRRAVRCVSVAVPRASSGRGRGASRVARVIHYTVIRGSPTNAHVSPASSAAFIYTVCTCDHANICGDVKDHFLVLTGVLKLDQICVRSDVLS